MMNLVLRNPNIIEKVHWIHDKQVLELIMIEFRDFPPT